MTQLSVNRRSGYTLIELVVSMLAATVLIAGLASAMLISSAAFDAENGSSAQRALAADVQADLMADLQHALSFSERTPTDRLRRLDGLATRGERRNGSFRVHRLDTVSHCPKGQSR